MKIVIAGGTGFLGKALEQYFSERGEDVIILTRNPVAGNHIQWDGFTLGDWKNSLENADVLINLTGKSVDCRYNSKNKNEILHSRVDSTAVLQKAISQAKHPPRLWLNSSSATIYVSAFRIPMTEDGGITGDDFSMSVCKAWEKEFFSVDQPGIRKVALRSSIVLGNEGGAFPKLKAVSKYGLGGKQGNGRQYVSWIHVHDFCRALEYIINNEDLHGPVNVVSPCPVINKSFMRLLAQYTRPMLRLPSPAWLLAIGSFIIRTEKELILKSRRVVPKILLQHGFKFEYPVLELAFDDLFKASQNVKC